MIRISLFTLFFFFGSFTWASALEGSQRRFFDQIQESVFTRAELPELGHFAQCYDKKWSCQTGREIFVQAIDELFEADAIPAEELSNILAAELEKDIPLFDTVNILYSFKDKLPSLWLRYSHKILQGEMDQRVQDYIESHSVEKVQDWTDRYDIAKALLTVEPPIQSYWDGRYYLKPRIFMFCRDNRKQPCLMLMKDATGRLMRHRDGTPWTQGSLGFSRHKKDFHQTNGNTPSGVFRIDGVMPSADRPLVFGEFRRLILNFVGHSSNESNLKKLLPAVTHNHTWWQEGVIARNNGRGLFRIHGTGLRSSSSKSYYPFVPTAGCVAKRENNYNKVVYKDQRELLDKLMRSSGLDPIYENETKILGLLYVIDIDKKDEPVTLSSLKQAGIID